MKSTRLRAAALGIGLVAVIPHQAALAQADAAACIAQADMSDGVIYAMPIIVTAVRNKCEGSLATSDFLATKGDAFIAPYVSRQSAAWPGAMRVLSQFGGSSSADTANMMSMMQTLPPETVRPLIDAVIEQKLAEEIKIADCKKIERGIALMAPLPPENLAGLVTFLLEVTKVDDPKMCPAAE